MDSALAGLLNQGSAYLLAGVVAGRLGNRHPSIAPYETFRAADRELAVAVGNDALFARLCTALGRPELAGDERFATNERRLAHRDELGAALEAALAAAPAVDWVARLREAGVPAGEINDVAQAFALAEELGLEPVDETDGVRTVRSPMRLAGTPATVRTRPPRLGEHDAELRAWLRRTTHPPTGERGARERRLVSNRVSYLPRRAGTRGPRAERRKLSERAATPAPGAAAAWSPGPGPGRAAGRRR